MVAIELVAFGGGVVFGLANLLGYVASALGRTEYWPLGERDLWYYVHWSISMGLNVCLLAVAYLDWNSLGLTQPRTLAVGAVLFVPSYAAALWAGSDLGSDETMGLEGELQTGGWYRYSRNPQYVWYLVATVGVALLSASWMATVLCALYATWWLVMPFAEEPWLREQYGEAYEQYADRVPRFVGSETVRALWHGVTDRAVREV
ncbi:methyltransferase family protein [Halorientalis brevis]|uniref:Methyltransferase family protein n=1 Tax=Halorientalis brevis TaxID=1126241 RepID=A0ABD6CFR0_9EURY|nr:PEMT/PEM2 methyltransferase family protein [Halorientalis brevis]